MSGIMCPKCGAGESRVYQTVNDEGSIRRRRKCDDCGHGFVTVEKVKAGPGRRSAYTETQLFLLKVLYLRSVPIRRIAKIMSDRGVPMTKAAVDAQIKKIVETGIRSDRAKCQAELREMAKERPLHMVGGKMFPVELFEIADG